MGARALFWIMDWSLMSVLGSEDVRAGHSLTFDLDLQKKDGRRCELALTYRPMNNIVAKVQRELTLMAFFQLNIQQNTFLRSRRKGRK